MIFETIAIDRFIDRQFSTKPVQLLTEHWNIDKRKLVAVLTMRFHDMGIFRVARVNHDLVQRQVLIFLASLPEIKELVVTAERVRRRELMTKHRNP